MLLLLLQIDQRRRFFLISLFSRFGKISPCAADIRPDILADCHKCFIARVNALIDDSKAVFPSGTCKKCCQWGPNSSSNYIKSIHPLEYYPKMYYPDSLPAPLGRDVCIDFIKPKKQSFDWLRSAVDFAAHTVCQGILKKGVMDAYLQTCAISKSAHEQV